MSSACGASSDGDAVVSAEGVSVAEALGVVEEPLPAESVEPVDDPVEPEVDPVEPEVELEEPEAEPVAPDVLPVLPLEEPVLALDSSDELDEPDELESSESAASCAVSRASSASASVRAASSRASERSVVSMVAISSPASTVSPTCLETEVTSALAGKEALTSPTAATVPVPLSVWVTSPVVTVPVTSVLASEGRLSAQAPVPARPSATTVAPVSTIRRVRARRFASALVIGCRRPCRDRPWSTHRRWPRSARSRLP